VNSHWFPFRQHLAGSVVFIGLIISSIMILSSEGVGATIRIMPLGNSITRAVAGSELEMGYRRMLYLDLVNAGYDIDFVGSQIDGLVEDFDRDHEGHSGWEADEIRDNVYNWLVANPADYVLLHIGTNDVTHNHVDVNEVDQLLDSIDQFETDYANPIKVLLARIVHRTDALTPKTIIFNDSVEALVLDRVLNGDDIVIVGMDTALTYPDDIADKVHPNQSGYDKMARTWFNHLLEILPYGDCPESMSHYWKLDEANGPIYSDSWATSDASCNGCPSPVEGIVNGAQLIQPQEALDVSPDESLNWSEDASFSVELWFRMDVCLDSDPDDRQFLIGRVGEGGALDRWWLAVNCTASYPSGRLEFNLADTSDGLLLSASEPVVDSEWHHAVAVRDGDLDSNILYLDGAWAASGYSNYADGFSASTNINIGYLQDTSCSSDCTCYLDEIVTYSRALSPAEVETQFNGGLLGYPSCEGSVVPEVTSIPIEEVFEGQSYVYDVNATADPHPVFRLADHPVEMTIDSVTGLIQWNAESTGDYQIHITASNIAGVDAQSFTLSVTRQPSCPPGLVHYWRLDELFGPTYYDYVGLADASGTLLDLSEGVVDGSQRFDRAEGDGLNVFDQDSFDWGPESSFSIELWVKKESACESDDNNGNNVIIGRYDGNPGQADLNTWWVGFNCRSAEGTQGGIRFVLRDDSNEGVSLVGGTDIIDGEWHHVVAIRDASLQQNMVYIDGNLDAITSYTYLDGFADDSPINIGHIALVGQHRLDGYLDELAIHSRALSEADIIEHYLNGLRGLGVCPDILCGDVDFNGYVDIDDVVYLIAYIFGGGPAPVNETTGDLDCSGGTDIDDVVYGIAYIFGGGPIPCLNCPEA